MSELLKGKVTVITGALGGLGSATARTFLSHGAKVVVADVQDKRGAEFAECLGENAHYVSADVSQEADIKNLVAEAVKKFGKLDVFFNNAGVIGDGGTFLEIGTDGYDAVQAINARSVLLGHKHAALQFIAQGGGGSIISTSSVAGLQGGWSTVSYTASKHTIAGLVHQAAYELGQYGIRSNAIAPGVVMTDIQSRAFDVPLERAREFNDYIQEQLGAKQGLKRFGVPQDIANAAVYFASDLSLYVNGVVMPVDGGAFAMTHNTFLEDIVGVRESFLAQ
ncbi:SDR family NAD(P)-dependent oxidoreductase [Rhodococcus sp. NPDC057529]|uniref:SDR family NAD(P)-dependent oxidoreductase n=1 Tax=Rhodococcus sp. NPDC057529 TaxID=3346158 RepID=UPI00366B2212